jgi:hypothetical protein
MVYCAAKHGKRGGDTMLDWIVQLWPFGSSWAAIGVAALVFLILVRFAIRLALWGLTIAGAAAAIAVYGFGWNPAAMIGGGPRWVLVSDHAEADGVDVAYSASAIPKASVMGMPVCDASTRGKVAVCGGGPVYTMGLPHDFGRARPSEWCVYRTVASRDYLTAEGGSKVYECR